MSYLKKFKNRKKMEAAVTRESPEKPGTGTIITDNMGNDIWPKLTDTERAQNDSTSNMHILNLGNVNGKLQTK